ERYYVKRFLIETSEKEEVFISENPKSRLEIIATDYRPVAEVLYSKRSIGNETVNFEDFIAVKGIKAQGNQLSTEKIKQVNLLESLPFEEPEEDKVEEIEVVSEEIVEENKLPIEIVETVTKKPLLEELSAEEKAKIALQKSIEKKKAEEQKRDDENQIKLF
ncbi:MAG: topoisomerase-4 subunit A, partial [Urechidicola sp.]